MAKLCITTSVLETFFFLRLSRKKYFIKTVFFSEEFSFFRSDINFSVITISDSQSGVKCKIGTPVKFPIRNFILDRRGVPT